ncbi:CFI-box-CTERM domain-containing protein [Muricoccus radiodurans]|uniref:CFI-box-CTERM domain-containing protein n=1 Tax=Muricoccus radiodurans TaxID=2231721 RepID=UPI003CEBAB6B
MEDEASQQTPKSEERRKSGSSTLEGVAEAADAGCCLAEVACGGVDCFVATAALGRAEHPDLNALRAFRDQVLMRSAPGRLFCRLYYRWGMYPARAIRGRPLACLIVRTGLVQPLARLARRVTR